MSKRRDAASTVFIRFPGIVLNAVLFNAVENWKSVAAGRCLRNSPLLHFMYGNAYNERTAYQRIALDAGTFYHPSMNANSISFIKDWLSGISLFGAALTVATVPAGALWTDFNGSAAGWKTSPWFGDFHSKGTEAGWLYHPARGWLWAQGPGENDFWMWEEVPGWTWTTAGVYPYSYDPNHPGWMYFDAVPGMRFRMTGATMQRDFPVVVATEPAHGAREVPVDSTHVRVTFDRPMAATAAWSVPPEWGGSFTVWSADGRSAWIHRFDARNPLPSLSLLRFTLNPAGNGFADPHGTPALPYSFAFTVGPATTTGPRLVRSDPSSGATDVDPWLDTVVFEFSEPMAPHGGLQSSGWWPWSMTWSDDSRTCYVTRESAGEPLFGQKVMLRPINFRTAVGADLIIEHFVTFETADPPSTRFTGAADKGFHWPYYLFVPAHVESPATLLVETNNTGTWSDDPWVHEESALTLLRRRSAFATEIGSPLLVPVFPRPMSPPAPEPGGIYVHSLDRYSLGDTWQGLERMDLQMEAIIDDALARLRDAGHAMDSRVFMMGFSASGSFTSRFALLHPERVKAAAAGAGGGWPMVPVATWEGTPLRYPIGTYDYESLTGRTFPLDAFLEVALFIYVGSQDTNDGLDVRGIPETEKAQIHQLLNWPKDRFIANRWPLARTMYESKGTNATVKIYPDIDHRISEQMFQDIKAFFRQHR